MTGMKVDFSAIAASSLPSVDGQVNVNSAPVGNNNGFSGSFLPASQQPNHGSVDENRIRELAASLHTAPKAVPANSSKKYNSIEELIQQRCQTILKDLYNNEFENTRQRCDKINASRMKKEWEIQKDLYTKEIVGDRRLGGSSSVTKYKSMTSGTSSMSSTQFSHMAMDHVDLISRWNEDSDLTAMIEKFKRISTKYPAYAAAWDLVERLKMGKSELPIGKAIATLSHLGRQFQNHFTNRVRSAHMNGQIQQLDSNKYSGDALTIATYVSLSVGSQASEWVTIYYCLRCGNFVSAKEVLSAHNRNHVLMEVLDRYSKQQGPKRCYWDEATLLTKNSGGEMAYSYQDDYEKACWSLLVGNEEITSSSVIETIEDFIYFSLWHAIFGSAQPDEALASVGEKIRNLGPSHFQGEDSRDCWSFVTPLLLTQQYRSAISHLANGNGEEGLLQATHLCLFLGPAHDLGVTSSQNLASSLLIKFAASAKQQNASSALPYLVRIPDYDSKRQKIVELIVDSKEFKQLGGVISADGARQGEHASLDRYFSSKEVCDLLDDASQLAYERDNTSDALELLNLAERYVGLLSLLNKKLSSSLRENNASERQFWFDTSIQFNNWHFSGRRTHAREVLEAANREDLINVFQTLLKLSEFFNRLLHHDFQNASAILEELYFIPSSNDEVTAKAESFDLMDPVLQEVFPSVMLGAMEVMYQLFVRAKHQQGSNNINTIEGLNRLKGRAGLLNSLASMLTLPMEVQSRMTNMEAQMI